MNAPPPSGKAPRKRLSPVPEDPQTGRPDAALLSPHQRALRTAMIDAYAAKKARRFLERQVEHININRELADGIKFLFDEHGRPPIVSRSVTRSPSAGTCQSSPGTMTAAPAAALAVTAPRLGRNRP